MMYRAYTVVADVISAETVVQMVITRDVYEISRHEDYVCLFCSFTSVSWHPPLGT